MSNGAFRLLHINYKTINTHEKIFLFAATSLVASVCNKDGLDGLAEVTVGLTDEECLGYNQMLVEFGESAVEFATLYSYESYDITKSFDDDGFATASSERGIYTVTIEDCEISATDNKITIPFNAFPFEIKVGEYFWDHPNNQYLEVRVRCTVIIYIAVQRTHYT